ncbi:polysaccharide biosynthesis C-terminal domain-containing protein [Dorea formicigenerans]|uniref:polysaccharide biosynthesis C-terminal domain-containing protein n=1 Tax=Dorea formicigenerans TaxID=39486 RepID=UPI00156E9C29|nr:polysaccharide biosynthesis C-terminal domain-containing protein [Dorea formicigenerans]NSK21338.1 sugar isomerase [Dorea formicigenerans]
MKLKRGLMNIVAGIGSQLIILAFGMIVPRMMILTYGSEVNGFFSSISQLLSYLTLLEAGVGAATIQALYQPIAQKDLLGISGILSATKKFYRKISLYYLIGVCIFTVAYPVVVDSQINKIDMMIIILLSGLSGVIDFYYQATIKQLMLAEGRAYVVTNIGLFVQISSYLAKILVIYLNQSIVLIQALYLLINIIQVFIYKWYCNKKYNWIIKNAEPNYEALNQKNSFLIHQITSLIFMSTDTIVLTLESTLKIVSIYNVYNMIITALNLLCNTLNDGLAFALGLTYYENEKRYILIHDTYNVYYSAFVAALMSICYVLFKPFLILYTSGMDENYILPYLPLMFCLIQILSALRMVSNNLIRIAGHMPQTVSRTIIEAVLNLGISLILTPKFGIYGVLLGTIIALAYRTNDIILYADIKLLKRNPIHSYKTVIINISLFLMILLINQKINIKMESYIIFFAMGIVYSALIGGVYLIVNSVFNRKEFGFLKGVIISKIHNRQN